MDDLIDKLYRTVADEAAAAAFPEALRQAFGGGAAALFALGDGPGAISLSELQTTHPPEIGAEYASHYSRLDPWHEPVITGRPLLGSEVIADAALSRTEFYNDFGRKAGTFHMVILTMKLGGPGSGRLANLSVHRPRHQDPFDPRAMERLAVVAPHFAQVMQLRQDVAAVKQRWAITAIDAALDMIAHPAFVTDGLGRVRHANRTARSARGIVDRGGLSLGHRGEAARLGRAIADAAKGGPGGTVLSNGSIVSVGRLPGSFAPLAKVSGLVLVVVRPLVEDTAALARRCVLALGLTAAEAEVVAGIAAGESPKAIAAARDVGLATVRTLIRRALDRTGCATLRELTGLALRLPPVSEG